MALPDFMSVTDTWFMVYGLWLMALWFMVEM
jgi:hypothetical protein